MDNFNNLIELFKLVDLSENNYVSIIARAIITLVMFIAFILNIHKFVLTFKNKTNLQPKKTALNDSLLNTLISTSQMIDAMIQEVLMKYKSVSRITIGQFHNGTIFKSGLPFEKMTVTNEAVGKGVSNMQFKYRGPVQLMLFGDIILELLNNKNKTIISKKNFDGLNGTLKNILNSEGIKKYCARLIKNKDEVYGIVFIQNTHYDDFKENEIESILEDIKDICFIMCLLYQIVRKNESKSNVISKLFKKK